MSDLANFLEEKSANSALKCPVAKLIDSVRAEDSLAAEQLQALIASDYPVTRLHANLRKAGYSIARDTITQHKAHRCVCKEI